MLCRLIHAPMHGGEVAARELHLGGMAGDPFETRMSHSLEVEDDLSFQKREWTVERIGWWLMLAVVFAALLGLLGRGPLSQTTSASSDQSLSAEYDRFLHFNDQNAIILAVGPEAFRGKTARITLSHAWQEGVQLVRISPRPVREVAGPGGDVFEFQVADPDRPARITWHFQPEKYGQLRGQFGIEGGQQVAVEQFVFP